MALLKDSATKVVKRNEIAKCCSIEGCDSIGKIDNKTGKRYFNKGYCTKHYKSLIRHGDPLEVENRAKAHNIKMSLQCCKIDGCTGSKGITQGYCVKHYKKFMKYGDPLFRLRTVGENRISNPLRSIYKNMLTRCNNKSNNNYKFYGERGIQVCEQWKGLDGFSQFCADMGDRPSLKHSLERNDVNGDYCKENCRWAVVAEQAINKSNTNKNVGVYFVKARNKWVAQLMVNGKKYSKQLTTERAAQLARLYAEIKHFGVPIKHL